MKLEESPFYAEGGGQVADSGVLRWDGGEAEVADVYRVGDDQALALDGPSTRRRPGSRVEAEVDARARHATMRNHTATHLLHAALRERLGTHVRQAGSAVRPDKLRFDFTHGAPLTAEELRDVEDRVNEWIKASQPVRAIADVARARPSALGAMALFGEKYGDWVRVVEVEGVSRELCGGTHVANTAEIGIFAIASEGSSAANVRRIEAITGPAAIDWFRERERAAGARPRELLGRRADPVGARPSAPSERLAELGKAEPKGRIRRLSKHAEELAAAGSESAGSPSVVGGGPERRPALAAGAGGPHQAASRRRRGRPGRRRRRQGRAGGQLQRRRGRAGAVGGRGGQRGGRRWSAGGAAAATTSPRRGAATRPSSTRRWPRRGTRSRPSSAPDPG